MNECTHACDDLALSARESGAESTIDPSKWGSRLFTPLVAIWRALLNAQRRASDRRHLEAMDSHLLRDIGLSRADLQRELSRRFWEK